MDPFLFQEIKNESKLVWLYTAVETPQLFYLLGYYFRTLTNQLLLAPGG